MRRLRLSFTSEMFANAGKAVLTVVATTLILLLIGRATLGEAVIALLFLVPVGWSASRWGQGPGLCAAVAAALAFDFFFIPPFLTFTVGRLEGWLVLAIFLAVAIVVVGRIQAGLSRAQASEREAIFMYELSAALAGMRTQDAVAHTVAHQLQQLLQASRVKVILYLDGQPSGLVASAPRDGLEAGQPGLVVPILNAWGLVGEIQLWRGYAELPPQDGRLLRNFTSQTGQALERTRLAEVQDRLTALATKARMN